MILPEPFMFNWGQGVRPMTEYEDKQVSMLISILVVHKGRSHLHSMDGRVVDFERDTPWVKSHVSGSVMKKKHADPPGR